MLTSKQMTAASIEQPASTEWLYGFWYPALRSRDVRGTRMASATLLGTPLVLGRKKTGDAFALRDCCPHRGMPLSFGKFDGSQVQCSYHGWRFEAQTGQCREIPSLTPDSKLKVDRIYATSFPCEERNGYFWVFMPDPATRGTIGPVEAGEPVPELPVFSNKYKLAHIAAELPTGVDNGIIGLMDPAHGPFVHQAWWWRSGQSIHEKQKLFEPIPNGFRMSAHSPSKNSAPYKLLRIYGEQVTTTIDFVLPNRRYEQIRCGPYWFSSLTTVTPIERERCRIDVVAAWNIFNWFPFSVEIVKAFAKRFVRQDQETMEKQAVGLRQNPNLMLIDDADRPARWYFQLKQALLDSRRNGAPMKHPIAEPVTLRWRS
jgi:phenylpropionate dioxygenase-like ring-hydroxylating dioxygenase large terminal subunit